MGQRISIMKTHTTKMKHYTLKHDVAKGVLQEMIIGPHVLFLQLGS